MYSKELYSSIYSNVYKLLYDLHKLANNFFNSTIQIMIGNQFTPIKKYELSICILDIYLNIMKGILRYNNIIIRYDFKYHYSSDLLIKIEKMVYYNNNISRYFYNQINIIKSFNFENGIQNNLQELKINIKDEYNDILNKIKYFKISQYKIFDHKTFTRIGYFMDIKYDDIFEKLLDRYIKRLKYIELEIIKIYYSEYINIDHLSYDTIQNIESYISKCNKEDIMFNFVKFEN